MMTVRYARSVYIQSEFVKNKFVALMGKLIAVNAIWNVDNVKKYMIQMLQKSAMGRAPEKVHSTSILAKFMTALFF